MFLPTRMNQELPVRLTVVLVVMGTLAGCKIMDRPNDVGKKSVSLPPIVAPRDNVQLEFLFVDRPVGDVLMSDKLWGEIDQIGTMNSEEREQLARNGWRVGHASAHPPRALEELLELSDQQNSRDNSNKRLKVRRVAVRSGRDVSVDVSDIIESVDLQDQREQGSGLKTFHKVRCILNVAVSREQDGWVNLRFRPEIHHGAEWLRPIATEFDWTRRRQQEVLPFYDHQFSLSLNVGEMALITNDTNGNDGKVSSAFFRSVDPSGQLQRILIVRIANMRRVNPAYPTR